MSVLDVATLDGFYAFVAEARGARRVVAVDNEQYVAWVKSRSGIESREARGSRRSGSRRLEGRVPPSRRLRSRPARGDVRLHPLLRDPAPGG